VLHLPDVIGTIEIFELSGLQALAAEIEAISGVHYEARLFENDGTSGDADQDVGFLVKTSRVQIDSVTQIEKPGCDGTAATCNTFTDPNTNAPALLNDRPPLVLRATVDAATLNPRPVIIVVNHTRSFIDIELVTGEGPRVRAKRKAQAEFLADLLQELQTDNPGIPVMSVGDYNSYQFNDGYTDPISVIKGTPTADDQMVVDASPDLVNPVALLAEASVRQALSSLAVAHFSASIFRSAMPRQSAAAFFKTALCASYLVCLVCRKLETVMFPKILCKVFCEMV